ncbi:MAG: exo-alpha-sialidase, partial [Lentisphaerae bacterium]|nr:exo-alpha-sialidase [Lentisphaerota bacterium]
MNIAKFTISNDPDLYEAWPDVVLTPSGQLICVFSECTHHCNRSYTRIMLTESTDRGRTWSPKHPLTEGTRDLPYYYNCPRISKLADNRLVVIVDKIPSSGESNERQARNVMFFSSDEGKSWSAPQDTMLNGIVPDKVLQLETGRMIIAAHYPYKERLTEFLRYS